jgi:hypothetical protein
VIDLLCQLRAELEGLPKCRVTRFSVATAKLAEPDVEMIVRVERLERTSLGKRVARLVDFARLERHDPACTLVVRRAGLIPAGLSDLFKTVFDLSTPREQEPEVGVGFVGLRLTGSKTHPTDSLVYAALLSQDESAAMIESPPINREGGVLETFLDVDLCLIVVAFLFGLRRKSVPGLDMRRIHRDRMQA